MKKIFLLVVLFSVTVYGVANAGGKSPVFLLLSGILHPHSPLPPLPPSPPLPFSRLNDTGITWGGNYPVGNNSTCAGEEIGGQDCSHGRDATSNNDSDGHAGFSFTKLGANGNPLANQAADYATTPWACVQDNVTGLIWEVKTNDGGLHDQNDTYTCDNTNPATYCNTETYVARVNAAGWCGKSDWRMPTIKELEGIVSLGTFAPAIDTGYFPNTPYDSVVWSRSPDASGWADAWLVDFYDGNSTIHIRYTYGSHVWLVRGGQ